MAPHPDDEAIGAGGTVVRLARAGASVQAVVCTRGETGVDGAGRAAADEREAESRRACAALGIGAPLFLGLSSPELRADVAAAAVRLGELAGRERFDLVLAPWPLERHDTHRAALLAALLSACATRDAAWWGYGVWDVVPAVPDAVEVDVTAVRAVKVEAIAAHGSQEDSRPLAAGICARDNYQAVFSRLTGAETRRAVERLLDLAPLAQQVARAAGQAAPGLVAEAGRRAVAEWCATRSAAWAARLWE